MSSSKQLFTILPPAVTLLLILSRTTLTEAKACFYTDSNPDGGHAQPVADPKLITKSKSVDTRNPMCFIAYSLPLEDGQLGDLHWNLTDYTFVAGPAGIYNIECPMYECGERSVKNAKDYHRRDYICCCERSNCNEPKKYDLNDLYKDDLKQSKNQACHLNNGDHRIQNCSKGPHDKPKETRCRSTSLIGGKPEPEKGGCAGELCAWSDKTGECRVNPDGSNTIECCCTGFLCNGKKYMNATCRRGNLTYGFDNCRVPLKLTSDKAKNDKTVYIVLGVLFALMTLTVLIVGTLAICFFSGLGALILTHIKAIRDAKAKKDVAEKQWAEEAATPVASPPAANDAAGQ